MRLDVTTGDPEYRWLTELILELTPSEYFSVVQNFNLCNPRIKCVADLEYLKNIKCTNEELLKDTIMYIQRLFEGRYTLNSYVSLRLVPELQIYI